MVAYVNNRGQQKTYFRDAANRLVAMRYETDGTSVFYAYDPVGKLITRIERNGDYLQFTYDAANRLTGVERVPHASDGVSWIHAYSYDANGNVLEFTSGADTPLFDAGQYDVDAFASSEGNRVWAVPYYDSRNRMPAFIDANHRQTWFTYDVEGRLTSVQPPNGSPAPVTSWGYDVVGKLMTCDTSNGSELLPIAYGYDLASNRVSMTTGDYTFYYEVDSTNRLVSEQLNTFVTGTAFHYLLGGLSQCAVDGDRNAITLLPFADDFTDEGLRGDRWRLAYAQGSYSGLETRVKGESLQFCFPRGFWNSSSDTSFPFVFGMNSDLVWSAAEHRQMLVRCSAATST
jgi:YD repeat-containing protein